MYREEYSSLRIPLVLALFGYASIVIGDYDFSSFFSSTFDPEVDNEGYIANANRIYFGLCLTGMMGWGAIFIYFNWRIGYIISWITLVYSPPLDADSTFGIIRMGLASLIGGLLLLAMIGPRIRQTIENMVDEDYDDEEEYGEEDFDPMYSQPMQTQQPTHTPDSRLQGEMSDDGYEWIESPEGSEEWYWRDQSTGQWVRHEG